MTVAPLVIKDLCIRFGGLKAVSDFSLHMEEKRIYGLIGPNGAGKTTVFNMITGAYTPTSGTILAFGESVVGLKPYQITRMGMARTFQNIRLFKELSVHQNLLISLDQTKEFRKVGIFRSVVRSPGMITNERVKARRVEQLLEIFDLHEQEGEEAQSLPYGDQRRLEIARALATGARLLLLDEPAAGMNGQETRDLMKVIERIRTELGITILLIEHDMKLVMGICERISVLDHGVKIAEGTPHEIQHHPKVIEAYLGKAATNA